MTLQDAIYKIDRYLENEAKEPRIVDVPNAEIANEIDAQYNLGINQFIDISTFSDYDSLPRIEELLNALSLIENPVFLQGLSTILKIQGKTEMIRILTMLSNISPNNKLIILTYGCAQYLNFRDIRISDRGQLILIEGDEDIPCKVNLITQDLAESFDSKVHGIDKLPKLLEGGICTDINVVTSHRQEEFPESLLELRNRDSAYQIIAGYDDRFSTMKHSMGKPEQWQHLLLLMIEDKWEDIINNLFGGVSNLAFWIDKYPEANEMEQWLYFMALKTYGVQNNEYLQIAIQNIDYVQQFPQALFNCILDFNFQDSSYFNRIYEERRKIIKQFYKHFDEASNFCKKVLVKGKDAINYLTDCTQPERELILELIARYREEYSRNELRDIFKMVNPILYSYLQTYYFGIDIFDSYINEYKWCKVENVISPILRQKMEEQARLRDFNNLPPCASIIHNINTTKSLAFFVDAMGVEYLSYLQSRCAEMGLALSINVGRCELPSLTSFNKDFIDILALKGIDTIDIKDLDDIKHKGVKGFDYTKTKLPIHLFAELEALDRLLQIVMMKLNKEFQRVFLVSDHGASRLAVINENEQQHEMVEKGQHSGRCCPCSEIDMQLDEATLENDFWCLANYDRFRGGRHASVEVHGGASIEEVLVPVIEITKQHHNIECSIPDENTTIYVSFKTKASLRLFVSEICDKIRILINGKMYSPSKIEDKYYHYFDLPDIKRAGEYCMDVYDNDNIIARNLKFTVKKEGATEHSLF